MKHREQITSAPEGRRGLKTGLLAAVIALALGAALYFREPSPADSPEVADAAPSNQDSSEAVLNAAALPTGNAETDKALAKLIKAARDNPGKADTWTTLGDMLAQAQRDTANAQYYGYAEAAYLRALAVKPANAGALSGMAWVTGGRHLFDQSTNWANMALEVDGENVAARGILGDAALELGDYDGAFEQYQKMMDLRPDLSSWSRGAHLLWITGDKSKATWLMEKAIRAGAPFAENTAWCRARLALMHFHDGAYLPAAQLLESALAAKTKNAHVLLAAGRIAAARRDYPAAIGHYQTVIESGPSHEALAALGDIYSVTGDMGKAEEYYLKVEALHAAHQQTGVHDHSSMAKFLADHDRNPVEALRLAEQHKLTRNVLELDVLAWVYFKNGDLPKAVEAMKKALRKNTPDAEIRYHAGMIAAAFGDRASAQKHLQEALNMNPGFNPLQAPLAVKKLEELGGGAPDVAAVPAESNSVK